MELRRLEHVVSRRRKIKNYIMQSLIGLAAAVAVVPLFAVFIYVLQKGAPALNWNFFTHLPAPTGETGGGMGNAILGSLIMICMATIIGVPVGVFGGVYLAEYPTGNLPKVFRMVVDLLASLPSIVVGLFVYVIAVVPMKGFSAYGGAVALFILMIPIIIKTTEEVLKLLPQHVREAGLALGIPRWRVIVSIVLRGSVSGVITGVVLAIARIAGETAPLLITAFGNRNWPQSLSQPTASLPVQIYNYAISPYEDWQQQAWGGAFVLVTLVFVINITARMILRDRKSGSGK
ncbi:MAG TPA: phosphate ABC transporter permease PstA [Bdellovibrio sp.]|uniref:phosphate ABC transporter permease PstA n=1 Tax=Bdellovibrio sp. TaxID=28201 RepID=UPI002EF46279